MTEQQRGLILLIRSALTGERLSLPEAFDVSEAFAIAKKHGVAAMAYYGALHCGVDQKSAIMQENLMRVYQSIQISETQMVLIRGILDAFEANGIDHMALKGVHLRELYPQPEMRRMGDADILINCGQYETIRRVMRELGYEEGIESDHELKWEKKPLHVELHKRLIPSYNKDYYEYYGDGWKLAKPTDGFTHRFGMSPEDEMIYLFTHFAKHYRDAGIGIRHFADLWIYRKHHPALDDAYLRGELGKLQLLTFYENIEKTLDAWFGGGEFDEMAEFITQVILSSGEYGRRQTSMVSSALKDSKAEPSMFAVKRKRVLRRVFVGREELARSYPIVNRLPILTPVLWVVYLFSRLLKKGKVKRFADHALSIDKEGVKEYEQSLNYVGLDFNFTT